MAFNIPNQLPTGMASFNQGFKGMGDFFDQIKQHQLKQQQLAELMKQHQMENMFKKRADARAQSASGRNAALFIEQLKKLKSENAMEEFFNQAFNGMGNESNAQTPTMPHEGAGNQFSGVENPNTGMMQGEHAVDMNGQLVNGQEPPMNGQQMQGQMPSAGQQQQQMPGQSDSPMMKAAKERAKQDPRFRGAFKKRFGYDLLAENTDQKDQRALDLFNKKEAIKTANKTGDNPTNTVLTQNQQAIQGIDTVLPMLDDLINDSSKVYGKYDFSPSKKAAYNAKTSGMIDTLVAAQSLPKVQASIDLVEQQIRRATNEDDAAYIERLKDLKKDLVNRRGKAQLVIKNRKVNTDALPPEEKTLNGKKYQKINGEWHEVE